MLLNSHEFLLLFLPVTTTIFWILLRFASRRAALYWITFASIFFYAKASYRSLLIIAPSILIDYLLAEAMLRNLSRHRFRSVLFWSGVVANILLLGYFKYQNFFLEVANTLFSMNSDVMQLAWPLGLSFIVFQKIAFLSDVHSGEIRSIEFGNYVLFILFFPRTIAGPIVHYQEIVPQFSNLRWKDAAADAAIGACLLSMGLFKKTVIADGLIPYSSLAFQPSPLGLPPTLLNTWIGVLAYTFQLYFDFSGYSDMALGLARIFGVRLPMNFNSPLRSSSIIEFWSRWHITLTRFLTTYIYTPISLHLTRARIAKRKPLLKGARSTAPAIAVLIGVPTFATMILSGAWHGVGRQFIVWGVLHGAYLVINQSWRIYRPRLWPDHITYHRLMKPLGLLLTFNAVAVSFVFFRAQSVESALTILGGMFGVNGLLPQTVDILDHLGLPASPSLLLQLQPYAPFIWLTAIFVLVTIMPNSLELLCRYQPALDFCAGQQETSNTQTSLSNAGVIGRSSGAALAASALRRVKQSGLFLSAKVAAAMAVLFALGMAAIFRGGEFIYGQF